MILETILNKFVILGMEKEVEVGVIWEQNSCMKI